MALTKFTRREVEDSIMDPSAPLGHGGYGTVYRGRLRGWDVAIKVLAADSMQGQQEFDREVLVLGSLHNQHLLQLYGSCPELHALVYPFMENGSLQQRLFGHPGPAAGLGPPGRAAAASAPQAAAASAKPLLWWDRTRIAHETVLALMWLHGQQPPILHMDVKPGNILLDSSNSVKLADVGFAVLHDPQSGSPSLHSTTMRFASSSVRGTGGFRAPEYLQYGRKGTFTDVYATGVILCQLLTGHEPCEAVESLKDAHEDHGSFTSTPGTAALQQLLDSTAVWPVDEAAQLAALAVSCLGSYNRRPSLAEMLEPALAAIVQRGTAAATASAAAAAAAAEVMPADAAAASSSSTRLADFSEALTCPSCHDQLQDPVSTPGGITYCRGCILTWLSRGNTTCPVQRQPLRIDQLAPNYVVRQVLEQLQQQPVPSPGSEQQATAPPTVDQARESSAGQQPYARVRIVAAPIMQPVLPGRRRLHALRSATPQHMQAPAPEAQLVTWQAALEAAEHDPDDVAAWQLLGRCLAGIEYVDLKGAFIIFGKLEMRCVTAFAQHTAPYLASLKSLDLDGCCLGDAGVQALAQHAAHHWPQLQSLVLSCNHLGVAGVEALAQHAARHWPQLQKLYLGFNHLGVAGVEALARHAARHWPQLQRLYLSGNQLGVAGVEALAQHAAPHWPQLQELYLGCNKLGVAGVEALAQHAAPHWPQLQSLGLRGNGLGDAEMTALQQRVAQQWPNVANAMEY